MNLFKVRRSKSFGILELLSLIGYSCLLGLAIIKHEPWLDEAQSWLIGRDCSYKEILLHRLHYEGTPGLWLIFLRFLARAHISYAGMHWLTGLIAVVFIFVLLKYSPFPLIIRILLPFTFFLQYQFAVIARSYTLFVLGVFLLAALFHARPRPVLFAFIAGALANTSIYAGFVSFGFALIYFFKHQPSQIRSQASPRDHSFRRWWSGLVLFAILLLFAAYTAIPTPDGSFGPFAHSAKPGKMQHLIYEITFSTPAPPSLTQVTADAPPPSVTLAETDHTGHSLRDRLWRFLQVGDSTSASRMSPSKTAFRFYRALCMLTYPIANQNWLAMTLLAFFLYKIVRHGQSYVLVPYLCIFLFCMAYFPAPHHIGLLWITLLASIWIVYGGPPVREDTWPDTIFFAALFCICIVQIVWTAETIRNDYRGAYDGSEAAAHYLQTLPPNLTKVAFDPHTTALQAYFPHSIFANLSTSYWSWSKTHDPDSRFAATLATHPDVVVIAVEQNGDQFILNQWIKMDKVVPINWDMKPIESEQRSLRADGYIYSRQFCGSSFFRSGAEEHRCYLLYVPSTSNQLTPDSQY